MFVRAGLIVVFAGVIGVPAVSQPVPGSGGTVPAEAAQLAQSCSAHKFETTVKFTKDGQTRRSNVKLCGTLGQTDAQWMTTLRDAANKVRISDSMPPEAQQQVIAAIEAELARLEAQIASTRSATTLTLPRKMAEAPPSARAPLPEYSSLPPLPPPLPARTAAATSSAIAALPPVPPRLTIRCALTTDLRDPEPCATIEENTRLEIRAEENLPSGLQLRFLRKGELRGTISLAAMRPGQTLRVRTPQKLCTGVVRSSAQIEIVKGAGQVVDTRGPFDLRC